MYLAFIDLKAAFDTALREQMLGVLKEQTVNKTLTIAIENIYKTTKIMGVERHRGISLKT